MPASKVSQGSDTTGNLVGLLRHLTVDSPPPEGDPNATMLKEALQVA